MNDNLNPVSSETQNGQILAWLQDGNRITSLEALQMFGCMRLASRISDLRTRGYDIKKNTINTATQKRVAQYYL